MLASALSCQSLPSKPGVYFFLDQNNKVLYIGKAKSLKKRVGSYFNNQDAFGPKTKLLISKIKKIKTVTVGSEIEAFLLEANCIKKYKPKYNTRLADGKEYPLIRITVKDKHPKVLIARKANDKHSAYFGPFPNSSALRLVLKTVRRIFPFQSVTNHSKRPCLYYHLGLCLCPDLFVSEYRKNINYIIDFLNGKTRKVVKDLKAERDRLSKLEEFEKASNIQKKIDAIAYITNPAYKQFDYKTNPNLTQDVFSSQLSSLRYLLSQNGIQAEKLERIECYDISNISGANATGSLVVFTNGEKDSSNYRRFKIRNFYPKPNDFAMLQEVISRRLNHIDWQMPDLIIVDGGKGQISSTLKVLKEKSMRIPVIGITKKQEIIITSDFTEIILPRDSEALRLVMSIRDEAHRFAITYHRKLRSKTFLH